MYLIVGLGNPGREYENTRHNLGFRVVDRLASRLKLFAFKDKHRSFIGEAQINEKKLLLAQPQTFMNNSGEAVSEIMRWHKILPSHLIVIYDDVDLEVGQIRIREKGNAGGHHGIESIIAHIKTTEFARVRVGIGRENLTGDVSSYVLAPIPASQKDVLDEAVVIAAEAVEAVLTEGLQKAMNKYN